MEAIREHLQTHVSYYIAGALLVLPPFFYFRRRTVPLLLYLIEFCLYAAVMHAFVFVAVVSAAWFRENTQMQIVRDVIRKNPHWNTPVLRFWEIEDYNPQWLYQFELLALVLIFCAMWRYRPMATQKKSKKKAPPKKSAMSSSQFGSKTQFGGKTKFGGKK